MPKLNWSNDKEDGDGLVEFRCPKTDKVVRTFPTATVYFPRGATVHGHKTTVAQRRYR